VLSDDSLRDQHIVKIRTGECSFECNREIRFSIDGEDGGRLPRKIRFVKQLLNVFMP